MKKVVGYVRVSTGEQAKGFSLDGQRAEILQYCQKQEMELVRVFEDQTSGSRLVERNGLMALLESLNPALHAVVATEADRLSRDVFQYGWLSTHLALKGISLLLINDCAAATPSEKAFAKVRAVFAEFETELRRARIERGLKQARELGRFMNRPPLGYRMDNRHIVIDPTGQATVLRIFEWASQGKSLQQISCGVGVKRSTVGAILHNRFYVDDRLHGEHDAFIPETLWRSVEQVRMVKFKNQHQ